MASLLLLSSMLAAVARTVPFLVAFQAATVSDAKGNEVGTVFLATYTQAYESALPRDQRAQLRDLLERVKSQYVDSDLQGRAILAKEYLELATLDRFGECAEVVLKLGHYTGIRYRVCDSPNGDVVRLFEDLTTPQRVYWLIKSPDPEVQERVRAIIEAAFTELNEAGGDSERIAEVQAEIQSKIEKIEEEMGPGRTAYHVHEYEVNGGWEETSVRDYGQVEEILLKLWAGGSPEFSSRFAQLVCFLQGVRKSEYSALDGLFSSEYGLVLGDLDLDPEQLPFPCHFHNQTLQVVSGSVLGPLPLQFIPAPDSVAKEFCTDGKWDPPQLGLSFEKRAERMRLGEGW